MHVEMAEVGGPEVLRVVEREPDPPGPGEVRVAVAAIGVNAVDLRIRRGEVPQFGAWPFVPGVELVGTVEAVGPKVKFSPGERVIAMGPRVGGSGGVGPGAYRARAVVQAGALAVLPRSISRLDACALGLPALCAWEALRLADVRPGERVLVRAGTGAVGRAAIRIARLIGAEVVATSRRAERLPGLRSAGADEALDTSRETWWRGVLPVDAAIDPVGGPDFAGTLELLAPRGRCVVVGDVGGTALPVTVDALRRGARITGWTVDTYGTAALQAGIDALARFVERGLLKVPPCTAFPLAEAAAAHAAMEAGQLVGRVLLRP